MAEECTCLEVLRRWRDFDRQKQADLEKLAKAGDLSARGRAYEHELRADFVEELIRECEVP